MGDQQQQQQSPGFFSSGFDVGRDMNWLNAASKPILSMIEGARGIAPSTTGAGSKLGGLGRYGKAFAPFALAAGVQGTAKGAGELWDAYQQGDGGLAMQGGLRTAGGLAAATAGGIGTTALLGAGATAAGGLLSGTAATAGLGASLASGGAAMSVAATAAAPVAAIAAPIAAAIGLGFRGDKYAKDTGFLGTNEDGTNMGVGDFYDSKKSAISDAVGGGVLGSVLGTVGGGVAAGAGALASGVMGIGQDIGNFVTSW